MYRYFIDLFSGAGGLSLGFEKAGFKCAAAIDNMEAAINTHKHNFSHSLSICKDIRNLDPSEISNKFDNEIDLIVGGPPCPTFSTIGHAKIRSLDRDLYEDDRTKLFIDFLKYVEFFQPEFFVMENVPNFMTKYGGSVFLKALDLIKNIKGSYEVSSPVQILNAAQYGVPQIRKRMFLVGHKSQYEFNYPQVSHYVLKSQKQDELFETQKNLTEAVTLYEAISDLPEITDDWRIDEVEYSKNTELSDFQKLMRINNNGTVRNNRCRMSNDRAKRLFQHMEEGTKYMDLPKEIRSILPFREDIFHDRLKRLVNSRPAWTVIAHIGMDGYMYIHPTENRTLSVREAARIQSFPDDFIFCGNMQDSYVQVGNAVPPLLAEKLGLEIMRSLS
jgi:DNA (cytosine-5)-methyltransferase 1|tara:strand:- start:664 stop:1827 length:1164 start_codon:yes stop_codon:yes gene_type:complete